MKSKAIKGVLTEVTTFSGGDYYYLGLLPGSYRAYVDPDQLARYGYATVPQYREFSIQPSEDGALVEDLKFDLVPAAQAGN